MRTLNIAISSLSLLLCTSCYNPQEPHIECSSIGQHRPILIRFENDLALNNSSQKDFDALCSSFNSKLVKLGFNPTPAFSYEPQCLKVTLKEVSHEGHKGITIASDKEFLVVSIEGDIDHRHFSKSYY